MPIAATAIDSHIPDDRQQSRTTPMIEALAKSNGCTTTTAAVTPSPCVAYQGCQEGFSVIWCVQPGDQHAMANFAPDAITKFFQLYF